MIPRYECLILWVSYFFKWSAFTNDAIVVGCLWGSAKLKALTIYDG